MKIKTALLVLLALIVAGSALAQNLGKPRTAQGSRPVGRPGGVSGQWWGPGAPNQILVVQGKVTQVGNNTITLSLDRGLQTFAVTDKTEIMVEGKSGTLADIKVDGPCIVRMQLVPQGFPIALAIRARPLAEGPKPQSVAGVVADVAADHININAPKGPMGFAVNAQTRVLVYGKKAAIGDVKVGVQAEVAFLPANGTAPVALRISVQKPRFEGIVTAISGNTITLKSKNHVFTVTATPDTKIKFHDSAATLADIKVGYHVVAVGDASGDSMTALEMQVSPPVRKGVVTAVNGNEITIATVEQIIITGQLNDKTIVTVRPRVGPNRPGTASDIKVESPVDVSGPMLDAGPYQGGTMQLMSVDVFVAQ